MTAQSMHTMMANSPWAWVLIGGAALLFLLLRKPSTAIYVTLIPVINWSFVHVPMTPLPDGGSFQPLAIVTGLVLVVRDFAQNEIKSWVLGAMLLGLSFSILTTPWQIVAASGVAFAVSETVDWAIFTFTKKPFSQRVMLSSLAGAPIDTVLFLYGASSVNAALFAPSTAITSIVSKLLGAALVAWFAARSEKRAAASAQPA